jgi:hypothetical protein
MAVVCRMSTQLVHSQLATHNPAHTSSRLICRSPAVSKQQLMAASWANCAVFRDQAVAWVAYAEPGVKVGAGSTAAAAEVQVTFRGVGCSVC